MTALDQFKSRLARTGDALHMGTARSRPDHSTLAESKLWFPPAWSHVGTDLAPGPDVDVVCDAHVLTSAFRVNQFDAIVSRSVFEHLAEPWVVALQLARITRPGGLCYVQTHQTFPVHGYPSDYWRFTTEALGVLFGPTRGWELLAANYEFPCSITPPPGVRHNPEAPAFLNVCSLARRLP